MSRRRCAHTQSDLARMLRAAHAATGRPHILRARPDGSLEVVPYVDGGDKYENGLVAVNAQVEQVKEPVF